MVGIDWLQALPLYPEPEETCYVNVAILIGAWASLFEVSVFI